MTIKRFRVRAPSKDYGDAGPDLLRTPENAERQIADLMGRAKVGFYLQKNPPGDKQDWTDWDGPIKRGEVLRRIDDWQGKAGDGAKLRVGRRPRKGANVASKVETLVVSVREVKLSGVNSGAQRVADLARAQFGTDVGGFACREYNFVPGSGWSDHAWGDAVDLDVNAGSPGRNDVLTDWCVRMGREGLMGGCAQFIGSKGGKVYSFYEPGYAARAGGPESHKTHVHASHKQHYGANPGCQ